MSKKRPVKITTEDLGAAYRKAKVDLFYSNCCEHSRLLEYEENLYENLAALENKLNDLLASDWEAEDRSPWEDDYDFLGTWTVAPKGIHRVEPDLSVVRADPSDKWSAIVAATKAKDKGSPKAEFRVMAQASIDFHVFSALWILKVGHKYDEKLDDGAWGNRLRRTASEKFNELSLGSFRPYLTPYREWRDNGISAMRSALENKKRVVAVTADVKSFYHRLDPCFMLDGDFLSIIGLKLRRSERRLTYLFLDALSAWAKQTPLGTGLPVGLPASGLVANMALAELDHLVHKEIAPLYYGRYVDDIILVMEDGVGFTGSEDVWEWVFARSSGTLRWASNDKQCIVFTPSYLSDSTVEFANSKNKVFLLSGNAGMTLVDVLSKQIHEQSSEWRALPNLPEDPSHIAAKLIPVSQGDGQAADSLRKADVHSMRRAGFAIKLRDFEAYNRNLPASAWKQHRCAFLQAFMDHALVLPTFFELAQYLPRVVQLATSCGDFQKLHALLTRLDDLHATLKKDCTATINACEEDASLPSGAVVNTWWASCVSVIRDAIRSSFPLKLSASSKREWQDCLNNKAGARIDDYTSKSDIAELQEWTRRFFIHDIAYVPFKTVSMPREMVDTTKLPLRSHFAMCDDVAELLPVVCSSLSDLCRAMRMRGQSIPFGLAFATRPLNLIDFYLIINDPYMERNRDRIAQWALATRGFRPTGQLPVRFDDRIIIPCESDGQKPAVGVTSWHTSRESWCAAVRGTSDPDVGRYGRLMRLLNTITGSPSCPNYLVLPELSVPPRWFMSIALKLRVRRTSLICGVEYLRRKRRGITTVSNQVWASLLHDGLGFPSLVVYRQDKQQAALHEEAGLWNVGGACLVPRMTWGSPPILIHGDFHFALLICSELTNIQYRADLRGEIDAIFIVEWNQDTETFSPIVETAAIDIHTYVIQCNNHQYGDSRIRGPYKKSWKRDIVRVKGGIDDYFVIARLDVAALRRFQSHHRSPDKPYKPVPDGFAISESRRAP